MKRKNYMTILLFLVGILLNVEKSYAQQKNDDKNTEKVLIDLSRKKWKWMSDKNINLLNDLFHEKSVFVHMGGTMNKNQELNTIENGSIHYKQAEIKDISVRFVDNTAIVLDQIVLTAIVGGKEVVNLFMVTEIYIHIENEWKLAVLSFTKLLDKNQQKR